MLVPQIAPSPAPSGGELVYTEPALAWPILTQRILGLALLGAPEPDVAAPLEHSPATGVHVAWDAPRACPSSAQVETSLAARLTDLPVRVVPAAEADRWAIARVRRDKGSWNLRLWMPTSNGLRDRSLDGPSCTALVEAAATIIAMTLEGELARETRAGPREPDADDVARDEAELEAALAGLLELRAGESAALRDSSMPADPAEAQDLQPRGAMRIDGGVGTGVLPNLNGGVAITGAVVWPHARIELRGAYWGGGVVQIDANDDARARFTLLSATVRGCGVPVSRRWDFPICVGVETGGVMGRIEGLRFLHAPVLPWLGVHLASMIAWAPIPRLSVVATLEPWIAALRSRHSAITGEIHASNRVGFRGYLGLEVRFGGNW
jgi:hypothetical protein